MILKRGKTVLLTLAGICLTLFLGGCKLKTDETTMVVYGISPSRLLSNFAATLEITGAGFKEDSKVVFNNVEVETEYVGEGTLTCTLNAQNTIIPATAGDTDVPVYVKTPSEEERSEVFDLTISHQPEFNSPTLIYNGAAEGYFSGSLKLVVNEKPRLYAVWMEGEAWFGNLHPRKISISEDNGETWSEAKEIPAVDYFFVEDGKFHALDAVDNAVNFYTSDDDGDTWSTDTISTIAETDTFNGYKAARDDSGNIYLVYGVTHGDGITMILYSMKSTDHGTTWEAIGENSFTNYISQYQLEWIIVNNAGAIQVGYYYNYGRYGTVGSFISTDGGVTFNDDGIGFRMFVNGILEDDGKIYAAYNAMNIPYTYTFHFFKGLNYGSAKLNNIELDGSSTSGDMRMDPYGNLYIAWKSILIRSIDDGDTWTDLAHYTISENAQAPYITLDEDSNIYITWNENNELYFTTVK